MPEIARLLNAAGYIALAFDYRGFGDSGGPRWRLLPQEQVKDTRAALTLLARQQQVDSQRLALLGVSLGGSNALTAAALDLRVRTVIAIGTADDGERWLRSLRRHWEWSDFQERLESDRLERMRNGKSKHVNPLDISSARPRLEEIYGGRV